MSTVFAGGIMTWSSITSLFGQFAGIAYLDWYKPESLPPHFNYRLVSSYFSYKPQSEALKWS